MRNLVSFKDIRFDIPGSVIIYVLCMPCQWHIFIVTSHGSLVGSFDLLFQSFLRWYFSFCCDYYYGSKNQNKYNKPYYEVILHDRRPYSQGAGVFESCVASINDLSLSCEKWFMIEGPKTKSRSNHSPQQKYRRYHRVIKPGNDKIHHLQTMDDFPFTINLHLV